MWSSSTFFTDPLLSPYLFESSSSASTSSNSSSFSTSSTLYSVKVFLGGLPRGTTKVQVLLNFQKYGVVNVEMHGETGNYCFVIFKSESCCQKFIQGCVSSDGDRFFFPFTGDVFSSRKNMVEVKPFKLVDAHYGMCLDSMEAVANDQTIFVGGIPRDTTAETLAMKLEAKFGGVAEVTIDLDSDTMYPRGTAMVMFKAKGAALKAVSSRVFVMKQGRKYRLIELKPFLEMDKPCSICKTDGPAVFCSECIMVMGECCWNAVHIDKMNHKKIGRGTFYTIRCR
jgi:RNA recognition motif-containing protein